FPSLVECPLCAEDAPGFLVHPSVRSLGEDQIMVMRSLLGMPVATDYQFSDAYEACSVCAGEGAVRTGSRVQNNEIVTCNRCQGKGYVTTAVGPVPVNGNASEQDANLTTGPTVFG